MLFQIHMTWWLKTPVLIYLKCPFCAPCNKVLQVWDVIKVAAPLTLAKNLWLSHTLVACTEQSTKTAQVTHPEIRITHHISEDSLLSPVVEQEGEMYLERVGNLRRHSVTNAHSDIQLLTVTSRVYTGVDDSCQTMERKTETIWHSIIYKDKH